jgi:hypothetical protein
MEGHEGCNIYGWLDLQRLAGNFRISVRVEEFFMLTKVLLRTGASLLVSVLWGALSSPVCWRRADAGVHRAGAAGAAGAHG